MSLFCPSPLPPSIPARSLDRRSRRNLTDFTHRTLASAARQRAPLAIAVQAPWIPIEQFASIAARYGEPGTPTCLWAPEHGDAAAGTGVGLRLEARGEGRFAELAREAKSWRGSSVQAHGECPWAARPLRFFGGFSFADQPATTETWRAFGEADFIAPRWLYSHGPSHRAALSLTVDAHDLGSWHRRLAFVDELETWLDRLELGRLELAARGRLVVAGSGPAAQLGAKRRDFQGLVERLCQCIRRGDLQKAVLAQARDVELLGTHPDDAGPAANMLARLRPRTGAARFAFGRGREGLFFGLTPELLVQRRGSRVATEALAGTAAEEEAAALMGSAKDRHEHALVAEALLDRLAPLCSTLLSSPQPSLRRLPGLAHLQTPIRGRLRDRQHVLELVERLHPTPAVGGSPHRPALDWIARNENLDRGWFAAPVGYFDSVGDGDFRVALRCGLLHGSLLKAYAGAGIVAGSDPYQEELEIERKQDSFLDALDLETPGLPMDVAPGVDRRVQGVPR